MSSDVKVLRVLVDPKKVVALLTHPVFIQMVVATRNRQKEMIKLLSNTLEYQGYTMEEICAALEKVQ